jgi:Caspase domain
MSLSMLSVSDAMASLPLWSVQSHKDNSDFEEAVKRCIPSEFILIASQDDVSQSQEDFFAMDHFKLPLPDGKRRWRDTEQAGSVATCAFLQLMYENPKAAVATEEAGGSEPWNTLEILEELQGRIKRSSKLHANPTVSSSRPLGPPGLKKREYAPYYVVPPNYTGTRRALLIGCVTGEEQDKPLKGAINDVYNVRQFLVCHCGFKPENMVILEDNFKVSTSKQPTKKNILDGFATMIKQSKPKDVNFIQFSGHGGRVDHNLCEYNISSFHVCFHCCVS